jgi:hypothetical protein
MHQKGNLSIQTSTQHPPQIESGNRPIGKSFSVLPTGVPVGPAAPEKVKNPLGLSLWKATVGEGRTKSSRPCPRVEDVLLTEKQEETKLFTCYFCCLASPSKKLVSRKEQMANQW